MPETSSIAASARRDRLSSGSWLSLVEAGVDWRPVAEWLELAIGYHLPESKWYLLNHKVGRLLPSPDNRGVTELIRQVEGDRGMRHRLIDAVTINETSFFREQLLWPALTEEMLPRWAAAGAQRPLQILIAACSRGQELWSLAMFLAEHRQELGGRRVHLCAFDIDSEAVASTTAGVYSELEVARGLSPERRHRWLRPHGDDYRIVDALRSGVEVRTGNLLDGPPFAGPFDLILCRNVLIYFRPETKLAVLTRLTRRLTSDGGVVIGGCETVEEATGRLRRERFGRLTVYR